MDRTSSPAEAPDAREDSRESEAWKRPDLKARILRRIVRRRARLPGWHEQALGVLAAAEADGVRVLEAALPAIGDAKLRRIFLKHIEDEKRHTAGFTALAQQYRAPIPNHVSQPTSTNVLEFFAFLEITELRGEQMIKNYRGLYRKYPEVQAFMDTVIRDERYHASYLHNQLETWASQGLAKQVSAARRAADRIDSHGFRTQLLAFLLGLPRILAYEIRALPSTLFGRSGDSAVSASK
jgi:rubrerythrin